MTEHNPVAPVVVFAALAAVIGFAVGVGIAAIIVFWLGI